MYKISIQYTNPFKRYHTETIFQSWKFFKVEKGHNSQNVDFTLNQTWPTFYDYIPVYKISIQYTNPLKRYLLKIPCYLLVIVRKQKYGVSRADNSVKFWRNLPISNPKPDLLNVNAYSKFGYNPLLFTQVIVRKQKYGGVSGR